MGTPRGDRGQAVPLMAVVVALALVAASLLGRLATGAVDAARARTAADAAALAGVRWGRDAAAQAASANGGALEQIDVIGLEVLVRVRAGTARASARATLAWRTTTW